MPIEYTIDHEQRLVLARAVGHLTRDEMFDYQRAVWSRPDVAGYHELVDMTRVETLEAPTTTNMRELAALSASMDVPTVGGGSGKFAIVAPQHLIYGLGRMYEAYRELQPGSTKETAVFRTLAEATTFLGIDLQNTASREEGAA